MNRRSQERASGYNLGKKKKAEEAAELMPKTSIYVFKYTGAINSRKATDVCPYRYSAA